MMATSAEVVMGLTYMLVTLETQVVWMTPQLLMRGTIGESSRPMA